MDEEIMYVNRSRYRKNAMKSLNEGIKIPSEIAEETGIYLNHISNTLTDLKNHGLVECINPEARKGRLYRLTDKGSKVYENLTVK